MKLRRKVFLSTFALAVVAFTVLTLLFVRFSRNTLNREIEHHLLTLIQFKERQIDLIIENYRDTANQIVFNTEIANLLANRRDKKALNYIYKKLEGVVTLNRDISEIYLVNQKGKVIFSTPKMGSNQPLATKNFNRVKDAVGNEVRGSIFQFLVRKNNSNYIEISIPLFNERGFAGVFTVVFNFIRISNSIKELNKYWARGEIYLVDSNFHPLTPVGTSAYISKNPVFPKELKLLPLSKKQSTSNYFESAEKPSIYINYQGRLVLGIHKVIPSLPAFLIAEIPVKSAYSSVYSLTRYLVINYALFSVAFSLLLLFLLEKLTTPLKKLMTGITKISEGDLNFTLQIESHDEFAMVAKTFNEMVSSIRAAQERIQNYNRELEERVKERTKELNQEIREREKIQQILRESEEKYRILSEQSIELIYWRNPEGRINFISPNCEQLTGYSQDEFLEDPELIDRLILEEDSDTWQNIKSAFNRREKITNKQFRIRRRDNAVRWFRYNHTPLYREDEFIGFRCTNTDISDYKKLEEEFRQAQKMEAVGRLAGGVAHDFNNILTIIEGTGELIKSQLSKDDPIYPFVQDILEAGKKAEALTRQLLAFSRKQIMKLQVINLNEVIRNTEKMIRRLIGENITLKTSYEENLYPIKADPGQIEQVLFNLATNAKDAMPGGGLLTIATENWKPLSAQSFAEQADGTTLFLKENESEITTKNYVLLKFSDTGIGMDAETMSHIFEPFFTTKPKGKGTGLGLSTVYGIIKQLEGFIEVDSKPGEGTTFRIYLPATTEEQIESKPREKREEKLGGNKTILLVEDEEEVRRVTSQFLRYYNYNVIEAKNAEDALEIFRKNPSIDLLLTDVVLPKMNGKELSEKILEQKPKTKVLFMSGYTDETISDYGILKENIHFIQKPFTPQELAKKLKDILD